MTLKKSSFLILRELSGIFYLELVKVNKPSQIMKTIKQKVFHFERPLESFGSHQKKKILGISLVFLKFPSKYCLYLIYGSALEPLPRVDKLCNK